MAADAILWRQQTIDLEVTPMPQDTAPRLSHVGLYVHDVPKMIDFYSNVLGFVVSDGAEVPMVQQVSFNVGTLPQVQKAFRKVRDAGCEGIRPICHGNAWSVYFQDPEGNQIEMFCDTPWYVPQPLGFKIDLDKPADELFAETEAFCRDKDGFMPIEEWRAEI